MGKMHSSYISKLNRKLLESHNVSSFKSSAVAVNNNNNNEKVRINGKLDYYI